MKEEKAFYFNIEKAIREHADMVYKLAVINTQSKTEADDIFQDVFLKLLRYENTIKSEEHLKAWLIKVTINQCKSKVTSIWNKRKVSIDSLIEVAEEKDENDYSDIGEAVRELDSKYRDVIHLYYYEEFSIKEIAEILDCKEATIKTRLARGRKILDKALKGNYDYGREI